MKKIFERNTLQRDELLKSRKDIASLFDSGEKIFNYPVLTYYRIKDHERPSPLRVAFSVSKRKHKNAVDRNRIKRLMREAYRINKHSLLKNLESSHKGMNLMLIYVSENRATLEAVSDGIGFILKKLNEGITKR